MKSTYVIECSDCSTNHDQQKRIAELEDENERLQEVEARGLYKVCKKHSVLFASSRSMPCPACAAEKLKEERDTLRVENEWLREIIKT